MFLSKEDVEHIAILCRIAMTEEEVEQMREQLSNILAQIDVIQQLNTENIPDTSNFGLLHSVLRPDEVRPSTAKEDILANAPRRNGDFFQVPVVVEE